MKKTNLIKLIAQKRKEKEFKKPKYDINDLYVGEIVYITNIEWAGKGVMNYKYKTIKDFAIFRESHDLLNADYIHLSDQMLNTIGSTFQKDYAINNLTPLKDLFTLQIRKGTFPKKVSKAFLVKLENELNKEYDYNQKEDDLFKV